jgi:hypothetical protein
MRNKESKELSRESNLPLLGVAFFIRLLEQNLFVNLSIIGFDDNILLKLQLVLLIHIFKCVGIQVKIIS